MTATPPAFQIKRATERDVPTILSLIKGLAEYEKLSHEVTATEEGLRHTLFGERPAAEVVLGYAGDQPVAFALFFQNYSTFLGKPGLYLEDLFVLPQWRGHGFGRQLLAHLAALAVERDCGRFEWSVLDWNEPAIRFYKSLGAKLMDGWSIFRVTGDGLQHLASQRAAVSQ
jgi:GNAT superfamily N-acetyltransferase